jgi:hypothetical protein
MGNFEKRRIVSRIKRRDITQIVAKIVPVLPKKSIANQILVVIMITLLKIGKLNEPHGAA